MDTLPRHFGRLAPLLLVAASALSVGCNYVTGANDLSVDEDHPARTNDDTTTPSSGSTGSGGASSTSTSTGEDPPPVAPKMLDAAGVSIQEIAIYQGVKRPLMAGGSKASTSIPVIAGRDAVMRVFVGLDGNYNGAPVTARLYLDGAAEPLEEIVTPNGNPSEGSLGSTLNFDIPGDLVTASFAYRVELLQDEDGGGVAGGTAHYPSEGLEGIGAKDTGSTLKIVLVPIAYGADGSNRLPDTSSSQIQKYADAFYAAYPTPFVDITVHASVQYNGSVQANGSGWDSLLTSIADFRSSDNAPADTYYYGIFAPAGSFGTYCSQGCVAGLGFIGSPNDSYSRAAIGLGFSGDVATDTAIHELGHNHGREHAPCGGAQGVDPSYPYNSGSIGVWGFDLVSQKLFDPNTFVDMMSYCSPIWVSDYTFKGLANHLAGVAGAKVVYPEESRNRTYDRVRIDADGNVIDMDPIQLETPPMGESREVVIHARGQNHVETGSFHRFDHLDGGVLMWPREETDAHEVDIVVGGAVHTVVR